ncbi:MAG: response regulator transcription factor [Dehalococcoidales bacterium]|nr:MAG: response regulator transcription factor [Dehalococcoidales bacterium]
MTDKSIKQKIGVFLVAESSIARQGAAAIISQQDDMEMIGQAGDTDEAFSLTGDITSRMVVLRVLPPKGSFEVVHRLRDISPETSVIVLAEFEDDEGLFQAALAGVSAYLTKGCANEQLLSTIRTVASGEQLICRNILNRPRVAAKILERFRELSSITKGLEPLVAPLSSIEEEVLRLVATGNPVETVAYELNASQKVVVNHITSIMHKLDVNQRTHQAVASLLVNQS